jgi:hypothetical protein
LPTWRLGSASCTQVDGLLWSAIKARLPIYAELAKGLSPHPWAAVVDTCHYSPIQEPPRGHATVQSWPFLKNHRRNQRAGGS